MLKSAAQEPPARGASGHAARATGELQGRSARQAGRQEGQLSGRPQCSRHVVHVHRVSPAGRRNARGFSAPRSTWYMSLSPSLERSPGSFFSSPLPSHPLGQSSRFVNFVQRIVSQPAAFDLESLAFASTQTAGYVRCTQYTCREVHTRCPCVLSERNAKESACGSSALCGVGSLKCENHRSSRLQKCPACPSRCRAFVAIVLSSSRRPASLVHARMKCLRLGPSRGFSLANG